MSHRTLKIFLALVVIHVSVFVLYPAYGMSGINHRLAWIGVNAYPWWPLYQLGLPVSYRTFLIRPNPLGWAWCAFVWALFYYFVARMTAWALNRREPVAADTETISQEP